MRGRVFLRGFSIAAFAAAFGGCLVLAAIMGVGGGATPPAAAAAPLAVDLADDRVDVTTGFTGAEIVLFGAIREAGEVIVVVTGPRHSLTVREKGRVAGIWINREGLTFGDVPAFYWWAASAPPEAIAPAEFLAREGVGVEHVRLSAVLEGKVDAAYQRRFRAALIGEKQRRGLYGLLPGEVRFIGPQLFRATIVLPGNAPTGIYDARVFYLQDGALVSRERTRLVVSKIGLDAGIYNFAHQRPYLYGLVAVVAAVLAGWAAGYFFRRV